MVNIWFQSTPPRGGRPEACFIVTNCRLFQSTPPRGGRRTSEPSRIRSLMFQSTPPRGGRRSRICCRPGAHVFQSTPPRGGRRSWSKTVAACILFQSTPPRGGRRQIPACIWRLFQSTPPRGGRLITPHEFNSVPIGSLFQSTPPRGGRPLHNGDSQRGGHQVSYYQAVSIHAPTRGARRTQRFNRTIEQGAHRFNPRPHAGGDRSRVGFMLPPTSFQSTPPRGGRLFAFKNAPVMVIVVVSIHAPTRGAISSVA